MSDNLRRYRALRDALTPYYPGLPTGTVARHLTTLAALMSGIVGSNSTHLPKIAPQVPDGTTPESRVKRFARRVGNDTITEDVYFVPYAEVLLRHLALQTVVLIMDGSVVGRGCVALMMHVVYKGRALPLAWQVRHGKKGHFPEALHIAVVEQVHDGERLILGGLLICAPICKRRRRQDSPIADLISALPRGIQWPTSPHKQTLSSLHDFSPRSRQATAYLPPQANALKVCGFP